VIGHGNDGNSHERSRSTASRLLVCRVPPRLIGLPVEQVVETMRPLPVERVGGAPHFVAGLCVIRGTPVPVVDVAGLLGEQRGQPERFVTVRAGRRIVALAVSDVVGVRTVDAESLDGLPPLLRNAPAGIVASVGILDAELLLVLQDIHVVPEDIWHRAAETVSS